MKKIIVLLLVTLTTKVVAEQSCQQYKIDSEYDKYDYFIEVLRESTFLFDKWGIKAKDVNLIIDSDNKEYIRAILKDANREAYTTGTLGWIEYDKKSGKLFDISTYLDSPLELKYNTKWHDVMKTVFSDKQQRFLHIQKKLPLYTDANKTAKSKKFLIKNDCALILDESKDGWYYIYFLHPKWRSSTIMWIEKSNNVEVALEAKG